MDRERKAAAMPPAFVDDYEGPYCFYKCLRDRHKRSPLFLDRNVRRAQDGKRRAAHATPREAVRVSVSEPLDGTVVYVHITRKDSQSFVIQSAVERAAMREGSAELQIGGWFQRLERSKQCSACLLLLVLPNVEIGSTDDGNDGVIEIGAVGSPKQLLALLTQAAACESKFAAWQIVEFVSWAPLAPHADQGDVVNGVASDPASRSPAAAAAATVSAASRKRKHAKEAKEEKAEATVALALVGARQAIEFSTAQPSSGASTGRKNSIVQNLARLVLTDTQWVVDASVASQPRGRPSDGSHVAKLYMHYLFKDEALGTDGMNSFVEMHHGLECSWCGAQRTTPQALVQHLRCCHYHFTYEVTFDQQRNLHVVVRRDRDTDLSKRSLHLDRFAAFAHCSDRYGAMATPARELEVEKIPCVIVSQRQDAAQYYAPGELRVVPARQTYHVRTGTATIPTEYDYDSDADVDKTWKLLLGETLIDEFEDVSLEEKEFMKLWNRHLNCTVVLADAHLADACELFARRFAPDLLGQNLRHNFLLHLITLWDFSLLSGEDVSRCMAVLDAAAERCNLAATR